MKMIDGCGNNVHGIDNPFPKMPKFPIGPNTPNRVYYLGLKDVRGDGSMGFCIKMVA
jgi:hypothetical protein